MTHSVASTLSEKLNTAFEPAYLDVTNESNNHNVPVGSESHFRITLVSDNFVGQRLIQRHRTVNDCLKEELAHKIHALALHTYTCEEWAKRQANVPVSPDCHGGEK